MAFEILKSLLLFSAISAQLACATGERRFPLRDPLWHDSDRRPVSVACERRADERDPNHLACAPEPYVSPLAWDGVDNSVFRPLSEAFAVEASHESTNVNAFDEVPDSAWFQNRLGREHPARATLLRGACSADEQLDGASAAPGSWRIDKGKSNGASAGFRIRVGDKKFMLKADVQAQPERPSAASAIGAAIYHAVGFNTSCEQIVYFDPKALRLDPGLKVTDNSGVTRAFDQKALDGVLAGATHRGSQIRMQASAWLPGYLLGPFRYEGTRDDDPNDVIPHEDRRELRGARLLAAWLNHFDAREQNTMDAWIADNPRVPDASPGYVRHYYLDTSDCFGSEWDWDGISRRLGQSYLLDWGDIATDFVTLGSVTRPWEVARREPGFETFGYFGYKTFDPEAWKNEYPNPAFSRATEHDNAWMARILARFERSDIDALVTLGRFSRPADEHYLAEVLEQRLRLILHRYFSRLSPLADLRVEGGSQLCATDLARARRVYPVRAFRYSARHAGEGAPRTLEVGVRPRGELCIPLPASPGASPHDPRYETVTIHNGIAHGALRAHLYAMGAHVHRLVGIERLDEPAGSEPPRHARGAEARR